MDWAFVLLLPEIHISLQISPCNRVARGTQMLRFAFTFLTTPDSGETRKNIWCDSSGDELLEMQKAQFCCIALLGRFSADTKYFILKM